MKICHKDKINNCLCDECNGKYVTMNLGVLYCYQGDQVLEITHIGSDLQNSDIEVSNLLRKRVLWEMDGVVQPMELDN